MSSKAEILSTIIKSRRSIFPESYTQQEIPTSVIEQILESANYWLGTGFCEGGIRD